MDTKVCSLCGKELPVEKFWKDSTHKDGLNSQCIDCAKSSWKKRYEKNNPESTQKTKEIEELAKSGYKKCPRCEKILPLSSFAKSNRGKWGVASICKDCRNAAHIKKPKEIISEEERKRRTKESKRRYYYEVYQEKAKENSKRHRKKPGVLEEIKRKENERYATEPIYRLIKNTRSMLAYAFRKKKSKKKNSSEEILGMNFEEFTKYLLDTFKNKYGRDWDGVEKVHIDHIIPLAAAETEDDVLKLCHYSNLQLLLAKDNLSKSDKVGDDGVNIRSIKRLMGNDYFGQDRTFYDNLTEYNVVTSKFA